MQAVKSDPFTFALKMRSHFFLKYRLYNNAALVFRMHFVKQASVFE